jgi:hypothetical protein
MGKDYSIETLGNEYIQKSYVTRDRNLKTIEVRRTKI